VIDSAILRGEAASFAASDWDKKNIVDIRAPQTANHRKRAAIGRRCEAYIAAPQVIRCDLAAFERLEGALVDANRAAFTGLKCLSLPARSPNLNAHEKRWVRSIQEEFLSKLILCGEKSLQRVVSNFLEHYHQERNHQGNLLLFPVAVPKAGSRVAIRCREQLGGLLKYYSRAA
jgi:hypothetical protein